MNKPTKTAPQTNGTDNELTDDALETVSGGAAYLKFDGIKGESRKGGVVYSWKIEEGTK